MADDPFEWSRKALNGEIPMRDPVEAKRYWRNRRYKDYCIASWPETLVKMFVDNEATLHEHGLEERDRIAIQGLLVQIGSAFWEHKREYDTDLDQ